MPKKKQKKDKRNLVKQDSRKQSRQEGNGCTFGLLRKQQAFLNSLPTDERNNFFSNSCVDPSRRGELWMKQADFGAELVNKYSWATPDPRAVKILRHFSPIVEIGCGANAYWCQTMTDAGIDVVGYDVRPDEGGQIPDQQKGQKKPSTTKSFPVKKGGPEVLSQNAMKCRTLFLCYVDEDAPVTGEDSREEPLTLGEACLEQFQGDHIIHVGELCGDTLSMDQAPWGRSSGPIFQQRLAAEYHCLLKAKLTNWLHVRDTISVWKRTETCKIVFAPEDDDNEEEQDEEEVEYKHIPVEERLPVDVAAPCLQHLLGQTEMGSPIPEVHGDHPVQQATSASLDENMELTLNKNGTDLLEADQPDRKAEKETKKAKNNKKKKRKLSTGGSKSDDYECPW